MSTPEVFFNFIFSIISHNFLESIPCMAGPPRVQGRGLGGASHYRFSHHFLGVSLARELAGGEDILVLSLNLSRGPGPRGAWLWMSHFREGV